jgi:hypothetical protein
MKVINHQILKNNIISLIIIIIIINKINNYNKTINFNITNPNRVVVNQVILIKIPSNQD